MNGPRDEHAYGCECPECAEYREELMDARHDAMVDRMMMDNAEAGR